MGGRPYRLPVSLEEDRGGLFASGTCGFQLELGDGLLEVLGGVGDARELVVRALCSHGEDAPLKVSRGPR